MTQLRLCTANKSFEFNTIGKRQGLHWFPSSGDRGWYILYYIIDQGIFQLAWDVLCKPKDHYNLNAQYPRSLDKFVRK